MNFKLDFSNLLMKTSNVVAMGQCVLSSVDLRKSFSSSIPDKELVSSLVPAMLIYDRSIQ